MKFLFPTLLVVLVFALAFGCGPEDKIGVLDGSGDYAQNQQPIYNGYPPDAPEHDAVVGLHQLTKDGLSVYVQPFCSGTLIAPNVVITAGHCLDTARATAPKFKTMKASMLAIYVGDDPSVDILDHLYVVSETVIYPAYNRRALRNDIALVRLATDITEPVAPVPNLPAGIGFTSADVGTLINIAGFGETETGDSGVKLQVDVELGSLGCDIYGCPDAGDAATQIAYAQSEAGPCFGDSGGPAFAYRDGVAYVGGLTSYGDSYCTIYGVSTRVDAFETWVNDFIGVTPPPPPPPDCSADGWCNPECAVGEDPDCTTPPPPDCSADGWCNPECAVGEDPDCTTPPPSDCGNGVCDDGESCDGRYDTIPCREDCPGKTVGTPKKQFCWVGDTCEGAGCP